jgi:hypothetical protein
MSILKAELATECMYADHELYAGRTKRDSMEKEGRTPVAELTGEGR